MRIGWKAKHGLTLKWDFNRPKVVFRELIFMSKPVFERRGGEKEEKS